MDGRYQQGWTGGMEGMVFQRTRLLLHHTELHVSIYLLDISCISPSRQHLHRTHRTHRTLAGGGGLLRELYDYKTILLYITRVAHHLIGHHRHQCHSPPIPAINATPRAVLQKLTPPDSSFLIAKRYKRYKSKGIQYKGIQPHPIYSTAKGH